MLNKLDLWLWYYKVNVSKMYLRRLVLKTFKVVLVLMFAGRSFQSETAR